MLNLILKQNTVPKLNNRVMTRKNSINYNMYFLVALTIFSFFVIFIIKLTIKNKQNYLIKY